MSLERTLTEILGHFLRRLLRRYEAERAVDHIDGTTVDGVGDEGAMLTVSSERTISRAHTVLRMRISSRERDASSSLGSCALPEIFRSPAVSGSVALGDVHGHEGFQAKFNCIGHSFLGELAVDVGSP